MFRTIALRIALAFAFFVAPASASAQTVDDLAAYSRWSLEVDALTRAIAGEMEAANDVLVTISLLKSEEIDAATAQQRVSDWYDTLNQDLASHRATLVVLTAQSRAFENWESVAVRPILDGPRQLIASTELYIDEMNRYAIAFLAGEAPSFEILDIARLGVLQNYLSTNAEITTAARDAIDQSNPQFHLFNMIITNMRSMILVFEIARQSLGAEPSEFSVDDLNAALADNLSTVQSLAVQTNSAQARMVQGIEAATLVDFGENEARRTLLLEAMQTYGASVDAEIALAVHLTTVSKYLDLDSEGLAWETFVTQMDEFNIARETLQRRRQQLISQF